MTALVLPVIHYLSCEQAVEQAALAFEVGADGVFLITHHGNDQALKAPLDAIRAAYPDKFIGVNFLTLSPIGALQLANDWGVKNLWLDNAGVSSAGTSLIGCEFFEEYCINPLTVFASVAFKYQAPEPDPGEAARCAAARGYIPTTSGTGTGSAPPLEKIIAMSNDVCGGKLAIASGMTPDNVAQFAPYLSHIFVATGVSSDEHHFDYELLSRFIGIVKGT
jgi:hypothetical protein